MNLQSDFQEWAKFAGYLADLSGPIVRAAFRQPLHVETKADLSPVTQADRAVEAKLRQEIKQHYPHHGIIGEEYGTENPESPIQWVIDPIDGTKAFMCGIPVFGTLVAVLKDGVPVVGMIDQPVNRERWIGYEGGGTRMNGQTVQANQSIHLLKDCKLMATGPSMFSGIEELQAFDNIHQQVTFTRFGTDCYAAGLLAAGHVELIVEAGLQLYDYAALVPVITQAGGAISDWEGRPLTLESPVHNPRGRILAAANQTLHEKALSALSSAR